MKFLVIGYARHGKDTVAELLADKLLVHFSSSSHLANELFVFDHLAPIYGYKTHEECFQDRGNHRAEWHDLISQYNSADGAWLAKELLKRADIYVGMRSKVELTACKQQKLFDVIVWVDAGKRLPPEDISSCKLTAEDADYTIDNNGSKEELVQRVDAFLDMLNDAREWCTVIPEPGDGNE